MPKSRLFNHIVAVCIFIQAFSTACKREETIDVNQDKIYTEYELFYNRSELVTYVRAKFKHKRSSGNTLKLSPPSFVSFNSRLLSFNASTQQYETIYDSLVSVGVFNWQDNDGRYFTNPISINSIKLLAPDTLDRNSDQVLVWEGEPISINESIILFIGSNLTQSYQYITYDDINSKSIILKKETLSQFPEGELLLNLQRTYTPRLMETTDAGGKIIGNYRDSEQKVYLK